MTHLEFWINIITIVLLIPAIFFAAQISRSLKKNINNQDKMIELAAALRHAAETYGKENKEAAPPTASYAAFIPNTDLTTEQNPAKETVCEPCLGNHAAPSAEAEAPSEAELELLQALRSIK